MKVNKAQLADVLGVSEKTLTEWQKDEPALPMSTPAGRRGQSNEYDTPAVIEWLVRRRMRAASVETANDALKRMQAEEVALRVAERKALLVNVSQLEPMLRREVQSFKGRLEETASAIESELVSMVSLPEGVVLAVSAVVRDHVRQALLELSRCDPSNTTDRSVDSPPQGIEAD